MKLPRRSLRYRLVSVVDEWMHTHNYVWRRWCDLHERMNGVPTDMLRRERRLVELERERSYLSHPSQPVRRH